MTPARCGGCGREISPEDVSCPHCGVTQPTGSPPSEPPAEARPSSFRKPSPSPRAQEPEAPPRENLDAEVPSTFTPMHGLLALGALLIIAILWYGIAGRSGSENPQAPPAPPPASSPAPSEPPPGAAPAVPQLPAAERQAANDVLEGLKAVQSMAGGDVTFQDYTSRVLNTKVQVEKYLQAGGGDRAIKERVYEAMMLHLLAVDAWNAKLVNRRPAYESVGTHPALVFCPAIQPLLDLPAPTGGETTPATNRGVNVAANLDRVWSCAANKISEAERTVKVLSGGG